MKEGRPMLIQAIDLSIVSFIILLILLKTVYNRTDVVITSYKLFVYLIIFNMGIIVVDIFGWVFNGADGSMAFIGNMGFNLLLYIIEPIGPIIWISYVNFQVFQDERKMIRPLKWLLFFWILNAIVSFVSIWTGWFFTLDAYNLYHRGSWFWIHVVYCYGLLLYAFIFLIVNRQKLSRTYFYTMLAYFVPQIIGSSIQVMFYGVSYNWVGMMVSILIIYINLQNRVINTDYLTGTYNRRQIDAYFKAKIRRISDHKTFAAIMIDLKDFKKINDRFGHDIGDIALKDAVHLMRNSLRKEDFIARYGGDEFIIVIDHITQEMLEQTIRRIQENIEIYNHEKVQPFTLNFSMGYAVYDAKKPRKVEAFLKYLDEQMYADKHKNGSAKIGN